MDALHVVMLLGTSSTTNTLQKAFADWQSGLFTCRGVRPKGVQIGTDWLNDDESGKTFGVGTRGSAKYARIYDKAKQLGDVENFGCALRLNTATAMVGLSRLTSCLPLGSIGVGLIQSVKITKRI